MNDAIKLLLTDWIAPMDGAPLRHGAIAIDGPIILAVGPADQLRKTYPAAETIDLPHCMVLPGLVNAHVHLELSSDLAEGGQCEGFVDWLKRLIAARPADAAQCQSWASENAGESIRQCLRFGISTVGDISRYCCATRQALAQSPLRAVSFGEITAMGQRRGMFDGAIKLATDATWASEKLRIGITPHAPYSVEMPAYHRCVQLHLPIATHLAETPDETAFLSHHAGAFRDLWDWLGFWDDAVPMFEGGPIRMAKAVGLLNAAAVLAHVNYCNDPELDILAAGNASVVYCPRTHRFFGHRPHRWRQMLACGINVAVGTDSRASSPDLNLVDDLRLLRQIAPEIPAQTLWQLATTRGAAALGLSAMVGSLATGKQADLVIFPADGDDPLEAILQTPGMLPQSVWIAGNQVGGQG